MKRIILSTTLIAGMMLSASRVFAMEGSLGMKLVKTKQGIAIEEIYDFSPAANANLQRWDTVLEVNDRSVSDMSLYEVNKFLTGEAGTTVTFLIQDNRHRLNQRKITFTYPSQCQTKIGMVDLKLKKEDDGTFLAKPMNSRDVFDNDAYKIYKIGHQGTKYMSVEDASTLLRGEIGTTVDVSVMYNYKNTSSPIKTETITLERVSPAQLGINFEPQAIDFFGGLPYDTDLITFIQKFASYPSVSNIILQTIGADMEHAQKIMNDAIKIGIQNPMAGQLNMLGRMDEIDKTVNKIVKTKNLKTDSSPTALKNILANLYDVNKQYLKHNVEKVSTKDNTSELYYQDFIIVNIEDIVMNGIPFKAGATFLTSTPYFQYEYKRMPKATNGIYWPHYLRELTLSSKVSLTSKDVEKIIDSYMQKYQLIAQVKRDDDGISIRGENVSIFIPKVGEDGKLHIIYTNDASYSFTELYKEQLEIECKRAQRKQMTEKFENMESMDSEI